MEDFKKYPTKCFVGRGDDDDEAENPKLIDAVLDQHGRSNSGRDSHAELTRQAQLAAAAYAADRIQFDHRCRLAEDPNVESADLLEESAN